MRSTVLQVVTTSDPMTRLESARAELEARLNALKRESKERKTSERTLAFVKSLSDAATPVDDRKAAEREIGIRLKRLKHVKKQLDPTQCRDLMLIILFGSGDAAKSVRDEAVAILRLWGPESHVQSVCSVFPGLRKHFDA